MKRRIVLIGPPASGKGTFARLIGETFSLSTTSTGAILRAEAAKGTALGRQASALTDKGQLAPDEMILCLVAEWLEQQGDAWVFDGFPRTLTQGRMFREMLRARKTPLELVIHLDIDTSLLKERVANRRVCSICRHGVGIGFDVPSESAPCPKCGGRLEGRADDSIEVLEKRLFVYREKTEPLLPFYREEGILARVDVSCPQEEAWRVMASMIQPEVALA